MSVATTEPVLANRQSRMFDFIVRSTVENGFQPSYREIGNHLGIRSPNGVMCHLKALERKGYIEMSGRSRALRILKRIEIQEVDLE